MNGTLNVSQVTEAHSALSRLPGQLQQPIANTHGDLQPTFRAGLLKRFQIHLPNQARPNDNRIILGVSPTPASKVKMVAPAMVFKTSHLLTIEPMKALLRFF